MSAQVIMNMTDAPSEAEMADLKAQYEAIRAKKAPQVPYNDPRTHAGWGHEYVIRGGETQLVRTKNGWGPDTEVKVAQPLEPGRVRIAGMETTVAAAITAGLLPPNWKNGDPIPFDNASGDKGAAKSSPEAAKAAQDAPEEALTPREQVWKGQVDEASRVLQGVSQFYGSAVTDSHLTTVAQTGMIDEASLPEGVTMEMAHAVHRGYVAQADNDLAPINASVGLLSEMLGQDDLRLARQAVILGDKDHLRTLGQQAVERFIQEPQKDPQGFLARLEGMRPEERKCLSQDKNTGEWKVTLPGQSPMSYGAAVRLGIVKTS